MKVVLCTHDWEPLWILDLPRHVAEQLKTGGCIYFDFGHPVPPIGTPLQVALCLKRSISYVEGHRAAQDAPLMLARLSPGPDTARLAEAFRLALKDSRDILPSMAAEFARCLELR